MKKLKYYIFIISSAFLLNGCYTILWTPEEDFPSESTINNYYDETYYGDYYSFYDYPWWLSIAPPAAPIGSDYIRTKDGTITNIRNEGQGRNSNDSREIIKTNPPSRDISGSNSSSGSQNSGNSSSSGSTSVNSSSNNNSRSSDNSSVRNNNGGRNSNSGRK